MKINLLPGRILSMTYVVEWVRRPLIMTMIESSNLTIAKCWAFEKGTKIYLVTITMCSETKNLLS